MREWKMPHVCRVQFDTLGNCFPFGIVLRDGERVARLLVRLPNINSDGLSPWEEGWPPSRAQRRDYTPDQGSAHLHAV